VEVLRGRTHRDGRRVDEALRDEARVEVDLLGHRVMAHVLHAAREDDVARSVGDLSCAGGYGGERAGAHPVDGEAGNGLRNPGEQRDIAPERQTLVADLCRGGEDHVPDPLDRDLGIAADQLAHDLDGHVVSAGLPEDALRACAAERRADAVDEHDLPALHA